MPYSVTQDDILSLRADAVAVSVEIAMNISDGLSCRRVAEAGGSPLRDALRARHFLPVGSALALSPETLPFRHLIATAAPRFLTGKANELLVLHRCYESVFALAQELGCGSLALPFFSAQYYRFPREEAVHIALSEAEKCPLRLIFAADDEELFALAHRAYRKPQIVSYIGYYRDHAIFELDNGLFARVDLRPENPRWDTIPYFEACYRSGTDPLQPPLPEREILRLRRIYEESEA